MNPTEKYEEYGYVVLRGFFNELEILSLEKHVDRTYGVWAIENKAKIFNNKLANMHSLTSPDYFADSSEERIIFFEVIASEKLTRVIDGMFGSDIHFHNTQLFFNPTNTTLSPYWHRDMQYSPIADVVQRDEQNKMLSLHIRIPLVEEKGVEVVTGTHKRWDTELERDVRLELNGHKNSELLPDSELVDLAPGDILIFNAQMIHRGNYDLNSSRKAFDLCVGKYHPLTSGFLDQNVLPTEAELDNIVNNQWYRLAREIVSMRA